MGNGNPRIGAAQRLGYLPGGFMLTERELRAVGMASFYGPMSLLLAYWGLLLGRPVSQGEAQDALRRLARRVQQRAPVTDRLASRGDRNAEREGHREAEAAAGGAAGQ
jgi:hypothetical protein